MSSRLIGLSPDLSRLREEGFSLSIRDGHVVVADVPYVTGNGEVARGTMVVALTTSGERTAAPPDHTVRWAGQMPCHADGTPISRILAGQGRQELAAGLIVDFHFSSKPQPAGRYADYYAQLTAYIKIISHEAQAIDPAATAATFAPVETTEDESVFRYLDSASGRAGITVANAKLELDGVAVVGLGGTGSFALDLIAKAPIRAIHLFDGDVMLNHNAFRSPGAASLEELKSRSLKVNYYADSYGRMHRGIRPHPYYLDADNAHELDAMDFVFLCMDSGPDKRALIEALEEANVPFVDTGMGLDEDDGAIGGLLRVTTSTPDLRRHLWERQRISFADPDDGVNEYARNIQVADLNALNAALAVVRFKKYFGFYRDLEREHHALYTLDGNHLLNEDAA